LASNGLALLQSVVANDQGAEFVRTMLVHSSGEWFANETPLFTSGGDNASQAYSSGMTYARRYGVSALLCIAADDDDDGNGNEEGERQQVQRQQPPRGGQQRPAPRRAAGKPTTPAEPQAKASDPKAEGEPVPLGDGPRRLLEAKGKVLGLSFDDLDAKYG